MKMPGRGALMGNGLSGFTPQPRDLAEIFMMLDFIAGKPNQTIDDLQIDWGRTLADQQRRAINASEILVELRKIEARYVNSTALEPAPALDADDAVLLQLVKNALNAKTNPANAATIAYTSLYVGGRQNLQHGGYAALAHPELAGAARHHRFMNTVLVCFVLVLALVALWESASVALGKSILQARMDLRNKQAVIATEKLRAETGTNAVNDWSLPPLQLGDLVWYKDKSAHLSFDFCERPRILADVAKKKYFDVYGIKWPVGIKGDSKNGKDPDDLRVFETPQQQEVCDRDLVLRDQFKISTAEMAQYVSSWPSLVGAPFEVTAKVFDLPAKIFEASAKLFGSSLPIVSKTADNDEQGDTEIRLAPQLLVHGNFLLPVLFAFLGAAAHVVLEFYVKLQASTLTPHSQALGFIRLVLGMVVGTCIGLAFSSTTPATDKSVNDLVASLSLTASGVSFLAGFGVEGVFDMLNGIVKRVFPSQLPTSQ
jgi:hypothetical protein